MTHGARTPLPPGFLDGSAPVSSDIATSLLAMQASHDMLARADHERVAAVWESTVAPLIQGMNVASVLLLMTAGIEAALRTSPPDQARTARLGVAHMIVTEAFPGDAA